MISVVIGNTIGKSLHADGKIPEHDGAFQRHLDRNARLHDEIGLSGVMQLKTVFHGGEGSLISIGFRRHFLSDPGEAEPFGQKTHILALEGVGSELRHGKIDAVFVGDKAHGDLLSRGMGNIMLYYSTYYSTYFRKIQETLRGCCKMGGNVV